MPDSKARCLYPLRLNKGLCDFAHTPMMDLLKNYQQKTSSFTHLFILSSCMLGQISNKCFCLQTLNLFIVTLVSVPVLLKIVFLQICFMSISHIWIHYFFQNKRKIFLPNNRMYVICYLFIFTGKSVWRIRSEFKQLHVYPRPLCVCVPQTDETISICTPCGRGNQ